MNITANSDLGLTPSGSSCACCAPGHASAEKSTATIADAPVVSDYLVAGMTCSHCVSSVTEELSSLDGVQNVTIDLHAGGTSRVTVASGGPLDEAQVRQAVEEAGYSLASA